MITHIVLFTWIESVTAAQAAAFGPALDDMIAELGLTVQHGPNLAFREGNSDYGLIATFADKESWVAYQADPVHQAFIRDVVTPILANRLTIQF